MELSAESLEGQTDTFVGNTFVVSGVFTQVSRKELKELIEKHGGKVSSSISKRTAYVVAGDKMGPSKLEKAEKLEIAILSEEQFLKMLPS